MARRKKRNTFINILLIILVVILGIVIVKAIESHRNKEAEQFIKQETKKSNEVKKQETKKETKQETKTNNKTEENKTTQKPSTDEKEEIKNEVERKGGVVNIELKGDDEITIKKGEQFIDPGFYATYEDGSDASSEVTVNNTVDINKVGKYTISYYVGNNIIIRRVIVE